MTSTCHDHLIIDNGKAVADLDDPDFRKMIESYFSGKRLDGYRINGARVYIDVETISKCN